MHGLPRSLSFPNYLFFAIVLDRFEALHFDVVVLTKFATVDLVFSAVSLLLDDRVRAVAGSRGGNPIMARKRLFNVPCPICGRNEKYVSIVATPSLNIGLFTRRMYSVVFASKRRMRSNADCGFSTS